MKPPCKDLFMFLFQHPHVSRFSLCKRSTRNLAVHLIEVLIDRCPPPTHITPWSRDDVRAGYALVWQVWLGRDITWSDRSTHTWLWKNFASQRLRLMHLSTPDDVLESLTRDRRSATLSSEQTKTTLNIPASPSCIHVGIVFSEDDRIGYYPKTFRIVFTSSSCKQGLSASLVLLQNLQCLKKECGKNASWN